MEDLGKLRDQIDSIDDQIVQLFEERMKVAEGVAAYKRSVGKPVLDKEREKIKIKTKTHNCSLIPADIFPITRTALQKSRPFRHLLHIQLR